MQASPLALRNPSSVRAAKTCSHPAKPLVASHPHGRGLLLCPGPASPSWADPRHPLGAPGHYCALPGSPEEGNIAYLPFAVPKAWQPELLLDRLSISGHSERREIYPLSTAQTAQLSPPPLSLWTSHPCSRSRHREGQQLDPAQSSLMGCITEKEPLCSPGCCRAHHNLTLPSDQAFDKQQQRKKSMETPE